MKQADRAIAHDVLLFAAIRRLAVPPSRISTLVGLALAMLFLLLLALSAQMAFGFAPLIAASARVGVVTLYLAGVLGGWLRGTGFGALLAALYGALYGLLVSEDNALLLSGVLGVAMWVTR